MSKEIDFKKFSQNVSHHNSISLARRWIMAFLIVSLLMGFPLIMYNEALKLEIVVDNGENHATILAPGEFGDFPNFDAEMKWVEVIEEWFERIQPDEERFEETIGDLDEEAIFGLLNDSFDILIEYWENISAEYSEDDEEFMEDLLQGIFNETSELKFPKELVLDWLELFVFFMFEELMRPMIETEPLLFNFSSTSAFSFNVLLDLNVHLNETSTSLISFQSKINSRTSPVSFSFQFLDLLDELFYLSFETQDLLELIYDEMVDQQDLMINWIEIWFEWLTSLDIDLGFNLGISFMSTGFQLGTRLDLNEILGNIANNGENGGEYE